MYGVVIVTDKFLKHRLRMNYGDRGSTCRAKARASNSFCGLNKIFDNSVGQLYSDYYMQVRLSEKASEVFRKRAIN